MSILKHKEVQLVKAYMVGVIILSTVYKYWCDLYRF